MQFLSKKRIMDYITARTKLASINQTHLLQYFSTLSTLQQHTLLDQINDLDINLYHSCLSLMHTPHETKEVKPLYQYDSIDDITVETSLEQGQMGCILIAGGQGSRLGFQGPKGLFPISVVQKKSLFQLFAEKTVAASKQAQKALSIAVMTAPNNHKETLDFFENNNLFGLNRKQLDFFCQKEWPLLDRKGNLFLSKQDTIAKGANGNGSALQLFYHSPIYKKWIRKGIKYANIIFIDNPLADPFDKRLLTYMNSKQADLVIKAIIRDDPKEKVGVIASRDGKPTVVEYFEITPELRVGKNSDGSFIFSLANTGMMCSTMSFIRNVAKHTLPIYLAKKTASSVTQKKKLVYKCEQFLFDTFAFSHTAHVIVYPRGESFSPLKNRRGMDSKATVQQALMAADRKAYEQISEKKATLFPAEVSMDFYYPTKEFKDKYRGKAAYTRYID